VLPKVVHQHEIASGGLHFGIKQRSTVWRGGEAHPHVTEFRSHSSGFPRPEIEELEPRGPGELANIVDSLFDRHERRQTTPSNTLAGSPPETARLNNVLGEFSVKVRDRHPPDELDSFSHRVAEHEPTTLMDT